MPRECTRDTIVPADARKSQACFASLVFITKIDMILFDPTALSRQIHRHHRTDDRRTAVRRTRRNSYYGLRGYGIHAHRRTIRALLDSLTQIHAHTWMVLVPQAWGCPNGRGCPHEATATSRVSQIQVEPGDVARVRRALVRRNLGFEHLT